MKQFILIRIKNFDNLAIQVSFKEPVDVHKSILDESISANLNDFIAEEEKQNNSPEKQFFNLSQYCLRDDIFNKENCSLKTVNGKKKGAFLDYTLDFLS
tara:strand:+ start:1552 stop:1848 length:297 start_codon:yes stop_codon:yes gene_type:complete